METSVKTVADFWTHTNRNIKEWQQISDREQNIAVPQIWTIYYDYDALYISFSFCSVLVVSTEEIVLYCFVLVENDSRREQKDVNQTATWEKCCWCQIWKINKEKDKRVSKDLILYFWFFWRCLATAHSNISSPFKLMWETAVYLHLALWSNIIIHL